MKAGNNTMRGAIRIVALAALAAGLGAWDCDDPFCSHPNEFVTRQAGDAVQVNKNQQMLDPWPAYARNRNLNLDGHRASIAVHRYQANQVIQPRNLAAQMPQNSAPVQEAPIPEPQNGNANH